MSKCKPTRGTAFAALEKFGVEMSDNTVTTRGVTSRTVTISIPYEALRDVKEIQIAFQDLVYIHTEEDGGDEK